jgi:UDP-N-acetylglucosamine 2-epimerase (non-hydrolysing)/GDP/UDP-N,N'-diacetylbacillosamine 2-epimerase (hydrolysing)
LSSTFNFQSELLRGVLALRKIAVVTGTRAEYGLLYGLLKEIQDEPEFELQLIVTGMHLTPEFGLTYQTIEADGFSIAAKVEMLLSSDTAVGITKSIGLGLIGLADALERLQPDLLVLLGDRYEILAAAQAALVARVPVAHIAGGDTTEGAFDEAIRHSITKMAHFHFTTNEISAQRVAQLGEDPKQIFNVGHLGIDPIKRLKFMDREELARVLDYQFLARNILITFHPVTLDGEPATRQFQELLDALDRLPQPVGVIFTMPNSDPGARELIKMIDTYVAGHPQAKAYTSLGQLKYLSFMAQADAVVGNSSSGIYEAPSLKVPTVNIGDRQRGRLQAASVINCPPEAEAIRNGIWEAFQMDRSHIISPYGGGDTATKIITLLKQYSDYNILLKKHFFKVG